MSEIILFRYHRAYDVCVQTLKHMQRLNPHLEIHGLYGGDDMLDAIPTELTDLLASNWRMPLDDGYYKWKNGDLTARWWFQEHGRHIAFDHAYFLEWDMLIFKPLHEIYGPLQKDANYGTMLYDTYAEAARHEWYWMVQQFGTEMEHLFTHITDSGRVIDRAALGFPIMGGTAFCRRFLELFTEEAIPSYGNDETRLSVYSAAYGIPLKDNGIKKKSNAGQNIYLSDSEKLTVDDLDHVLSQNGDIIHPFRIMVPDLQDRLGLRPIQLTTLPKSLSQDVAVPAAVSPVHDKTQPIPATVQVTSVN